MKLEQFYDKALGHASYAILSEGIVALVDPGRDPQPYIDFAESHGAKIITVFETHPHADFASCHLELHEKLGAKIYINPKVGVSYPFEPMEDGDEVKIGGITMRALFTPGHSPDHNSYLLLDENGKPHSVYTGDSLFVGDVGRPDLREGAGHIQMQREGLARMMYKTLNEVFEPMDDDVLVYPAHGAGSLCGKQMAEDTYSTIGQEKKQNWAFQIDNEELFVKSLLEDQPFIPKYFPYDVEINRTGSAPYRESVDAVPRLGKDDVLKPDILVVDTRPQEVFKKSGHTDGVLNIMEGDKFETWLGSIVGPDEQFYLLAKNDLELESVIRKAAKIGYEMNIVAAKVVSLDQFGGNGETLDLENFKNHQEKYFIVDIRNASEFKSEKFFDHSVNIPLHELRERVQQITTEKPIVIHCAGGYRSAAGYSILSAALPENKVYDLSEAVEEYVEKDTAGGVA
ncbi:MAG: MBL fold metallo-hydrolase [Bacteroidetes bacterium]|nr:MAG: MBL fold metallo-hydrolase [Bacteroidota bacterium]